MFYQKRADANDILLLFLRQKAGRLDRNFG
jgi:hypothetical protein